MVVVLVRYRKVLLLAAVVEADTPELVDFCEPGMRKPHFGDIGHKLGYTESREKERERDNGVSSKPIARF